MRNPFSKRIRTTEIAPGAAAETPPETPTPIPVAEAPTVHHTYGGADFEVTMADDVSVAWYDEDWPEVPEVMFVSDHGIGTGSTVFDLGAHQCVYAMLFATTVGPTGRVLAVEASSHNAEVARRNKDLNHVDNLEILHAAVTETGGTVNFGRGLNGQVGDFADSETVEAFTIDQLAERHGDPDLVFLDIEGCEVRALHGAARTLAKRPICFVEVHVGEGLEDFGDSPDALLDFFPVDQYERYLSTETERHPVPFDTETYAQIRDSRFFLTAVPKVAALT